MKGRFRVRTRDGREIQIHALEALVELIRTGEVRPEDLVFDAVTGEWAPARSHSVVRQVTDVGTEAESVDEVEPSPRPEGVEDDDGEDSGPGLLSDAPGDLPAFDFVEPAPTNTEEETESLIAELEEEREKELASEPLLLRDESTRMPGSDSTLVLDPGARGRPRQPSLSAPQPVSHKRISKARRSPPAPRPLRARRDWAFALVLPVVALGASVAVARPPVQEEPAPEVAAPAPRAVPASEEQIRAVAYGKFVDAVDALAETFDFGQVPQDWLEGWYLAAPSEHPQVRQFWERYRSYVETTRAEEGRLYREAYLEAANEAAMDTPLRSLRMTAALEDFEAAAGDRAEHYRRVLELADAALSLDRLLSEVEGQISYEPARGRQLSADPVIEAAGRDPETQARLEAALDRVVQAVYGSGASGARDRSHLARWLVDGLAQYAPGGAEGAQPDAPSQR